MSRTSLNMQSGRISIAIVFACALGLGGCATKQITATAMVQPGDESLGCDALKQQIADNEAAAAIYWKKDKNVAAGNVAKGVGGAIPFAGLLISATTDLSSEEQIKARALADRNERLHYLAKQKGCPE